MHYNNILNTEYDSELSTIIKHELYRQENQITLIASENYASYYVMQMQGSVLTNKYAEGYPSHRYYNGCIYIDKVEKIAVERAKKLFKADFANVQPHSGTQANFAVYSALLKYNDVILSMDLRYGGHLSHGSPANFSGKLYNFVFYKTNNNGEINYDEIQSLALKYKPKMIVGGFSSYSGNCKWNKLRDIADSINAYLMVDISHIAGLVIAGVYDDPLSYAHVVTSTTHKTLSGPRGGIILSRGMDEKFYQKINRAVFPYTQGGPLMHVIAAKAAVFREALNKNFKIYQNQIVKNAKAMVNVFFNRGYNIVSRNTFNHLFLLNLNNKNISGAHAANLLEKANIIVNKNSIPNDTKTPIVTSGIRIGTPAVTKRGLNEHDVSILSEWICDIIDNAKNKDIINIVKEKVKNICKKYPVYKLPNKYS